MQKTELVFIFAVFAFFAVVKGAVKGRIPGVGSLSMLQSCRNSRNPFGYKSSFMHELKCVLSKSAVVC